MNLHEYQAKALLKRYGIPIPQGLIATSVAEAVSAFQELGQSCVVKAQVHAGGRGKAGGVKLINNLQEVEEFSKKLLGSKLITYQTDPSGLPVHTLLLEKPCAIERELYLGMVVDRASQRITIIASTEGGMEIEKVAANTPEKITYVHIDPLFGILNFQIKNLIASLKLAEDTAKQFTTLVNSLYELFCQHDLSLLEINPLVITKDNNLLILDTKINIDENALYRQPELVKMRDLSQENPRESEAKENDLNYVSLNGNIGCLVNGAGLAMATMDLIKFCGGEPANFLDVGGGATAERVTKALEIILADHKVDAILVNIFGGIVRCDLIAEGIIAAVHKIHLKVPLVVRLEGNHAKEAAELLNKSGLNVLAAKSFQEAAEQVVKQAHKQ